MEIQRKTEKGTDNYLSLRLVVTTLSLFLFLFIAYQIYTEKAFWFDQLLLDLSSSFIIGSTYEFISFFTYLGTRNIVISIAVLSLIIVWWKTRDYLGMATIALVLYGSDQLYKVLKDVFERERPIYDPAIDATGYSFPSGHATTSMAFYGIIIYFLWKYMKVSRFKIWIIGFFCCYLTFMGLSRVFLQAHYFSDVLAGFSIGFVYVMICIFIYEIITSLISRSILKKSELTM